MLAYLRSLFGFRKVDPLLVANGKYFARFDQSLPLAKCSFVVFDTELTGLNRRKDEIVAIGAVKIDNLRIILDETFYSYVRPENLEPRQSTLVHRLTPEQLRQAPGLATVLPEFVRFIDQSLLVGHFVGIDMAFLNRSVQEVLGGPLSNPCIDTMRMARGYKEARLVHGYGNSEQAQSYRLEDLASEFKLPRFKPHDALEDALQAAYLFLYLLQKLQRGGVSTLKELYGAGRSAWLH
jgi:DNA polymerase-3 subunit epsilon